MEIDDHLNDIKITLVTSQIVASFTMVEAWCQPDRGYVRVRLTLSNGDFVETAEYFVVAGEACRPERYRHQWMDATRTTLRKRWDNVPHFEELANFPHHIHLADGQVIPGEPLGVVDVLHRIAQEVGQEG